MELSSEMETTKGFPAVKESKLIPGVYQLTFDIHKLRKDPEVKVSIMTCMIVANGYLNRNYILGSLARRIIVISCDKSSFP